ncbi:TPA: hypothetical protein NES72_002524 [Klebsiella pneumoniae]|uniref:hypothetical protein n=1 Tax=Klebsiella TaxID=570 RepID=UPI001FADAC82|nr:MULTISPECIES: hypothetical protein [Klebsiella]MCS5825474.1 hypothetical protein [Klebsiella pneumoniae subsp. pneumoniae]MCI8226893.1 hypothetical protein [Klebsiella pneumoniae]HBQ6766095.1 hypothetical protein [Klebsiella pneumoniae]HBR0816839.1 hypothetical protein [Klebsiella pneumoniae]HCA6984302.1 hypothetical protein [Klebsiella pneumoniae]
MSLTLAKNINISKICPTYGISLGDETASASLVYTIKSVEVVDTEATAIVGLTVNGITSPLTSSYQFAYNTDGGDVVKQAEAYLLSQADFSGATQS